VTSSIGSTSVRDLSDAELVTSIAQAGYKLYKLWKCAMDQHATLDGRATSGWLQGQGPDQIS
jgi:hypothetical protein